ncbi:magnesium transporter CorA family protein [Patescibacteria group bacterium]|nr:magnesium transporter CorA family protein [Patescibacteria group bacterium]
MISTYKYSGETWIDVVDGTPEEMHEIMDKYGIHPFVANELTSSTPKPRLEFHENYIFTILHFPAWKHTHSKNNNNQEVDFVIGKEFLITARYDTIDALHKFGKKIEVNEILGKDTSKHSKSHLLFMGVLRELYTALFDELEYIEDTTENITSKIFKGKEKEMVVAISEITRTLLNFKKITDMHHEILESLRSQGKKIFGEEFSSGIDMIILDYLKINTTIRSNLELLRELRDTNNSLLTSKQNETVKNLTVVGSIVLPLNLIAVIFAMRTSGMPLIENPNAFWIIIGAMCAIALITISIAKHKRLM